MITTTAAQDRAIGEKVMEEISVELETAIAIRLVDYGRLLSFVLGTLTEHQLKELIVMAQDLLEENNHA